MVEQGILEALHLKVVAADISYVKNRGQRRKRDLEPVDIIYRREFQAKKKINN